MMVLTLGGEILAKDFAPLYDRVRWGYKKSSQLKVKVGTRGSNQDIVCISEGVTCGAFGAMSLALQVGLDVYNNFRGGKNVYLQQGRDILGYLKIRDKEMWELAPSKREFDFHFRPNLTNS